MPNVGTLAGLRLDGLHFGVEGGASGAACGMTKRRPRLLTLPTPLDSILTGLCTSAGTSAGYSHGDAGYSHILPNVTNPSPHFEAWEPLTGDVVTLSIGLTWIVPRVHGAKRSQHLSNCCASANPLPPISHYCMNYCVFSHSASSPAQCYRRHYAYYCD